MGASEVLVRHAMAVADPDLDPADWRLGPVGRAAAADLALRARLSRVRWVLSSPEPKAAQTARAVADRVGCEVETDDRLVEAHRPWVGDGYRAAAHRYLAGEDLPDWERRSEVAARMAAVIDEARARSTGPAASTDETDETDEIVVVGHGLSLSLYLEAVLPRGFDAYGFWRRLAFPDAWRLDHEALTLERVGQA